MLTLETIENKYEEFLNSESLPVTAMKFLLVAAAAGGLIFLGAAAPGVLGATRAFKGSRKYSDKQINNTFNNLRRRKLIKIVKEDGENFTVCLTNEGKTRIKNFSLDNLKISKQNKWDKKWRILIFDIPSQKASFNTARRALREKIKELGFAKIQKSVWAYPYPCEDELLFVAEAYNVEKYIEILTVDKLLHENLLQSKFKLNRI